MSEKVITEAVETCPNCEADNSYPNWNPEKQGYVAHCMECGAEIMLCDECLHADDNPEKKCDWRLEEDGAGREYGICFRGETHRTK